MQIDLRITSIFSTIAEMETSIVEKKYPISFRQKDVLLLGSHLAHRHSIDIVGMKRVGISNFLRFFLHHTESLKTHIPDDRKHVFILVDLHDLVERELFPFWTLTLKRIADISEQLKLPAEKKKRIEALFLTSIQSQELFLLIENVRQSLVMLSEAGYTPTIFFLRFDRINDVVTSSFLDNLQGLRDATNQELAYVFTSYRSLEELLSGVYTKATLKSFSHAMYLRPALQTDMETIYEQYKKRYKLELSEKTEDALLRLVNGNVQYLQLAVVVLNEQRIKKELDEESLLRIISSDERIILYTEELWESLTAEEKTVISDVLAGTPITDLAKKKAEYLWLSGFITQKGKTQEIFSKIFSHGIKQLGKKEMETSDIHFSKKEQLLMNLLISQKDEICEREIIIEKVWPEYQAFGVSDWAIDRLVARVRSKLKKQKSSFEIKTIRTRGYILSEIK